MNPRLSSNIGGHYLFGENLNEVGFTVVQSESFWLIFDLDAEFSGVAIKARDGFFNIHGLDNEWVGFFVFARGRTFLRFNLDHEWIGLTT